MQNVHNPLIHKKLHSGHYESSYHTYSQSTKEHRNPFLPICLPRNFQRAFPPVQHLILPTFIRPLSPITPLRQQRAPFTVMARPALGLHSRLHHIQREYTGPRHHACDAAIQQDFILRGPCIVGRRGQEPPRELVGMEVEAIPYCVAD